MKQNAGFTLIELMIVVAIIAVLLTIAYPGYQTQVMKSNRSEGQAAIQAAADMQEKYYLQNRTYAPDVPTLGVNGTTDNNFYTITLVGNANGYTITATAAGPQVNDTGCTVLTMNDAGQKLPAVCW